MRNRNNFFKLQPFDTVVYSEYIHDMQKNCMFNLCGYTPSDNSAEQEIE